MGYKKAKRKYWKPKVGDWCEFAFHPGETNKLLRWWMIIRAEVYHGYLLSRMGSPNVWFAMRHQLKPIPTKRQKLRP